MRIAVVTLFPEMFEAFFGLGVTGRGVQEGRVETQCFNPRDYATDKHRTVDDRPYGGGPGMLICCEPLASAVRAAKDWAGNAADGCHTIYLSPQGQPLRQARVEGLAQRKNIVLIAGRYEGVDQRLLDRLVDEEISIGDYVLSGGELPALVLMDALMRLVPGVLGHNESARRDSFSDGLLEGPQYTRPTEFEGLEVPQVLLSGDHRAIEDWRLEQARVRTGQRRPDLLLDNWFQRPKRAKK